MLKFSYANTWSINILIVDCVLVDSKQCMIPIIKKMSIRFVFMGKQIEEEKDDFGFQN